MHDRNDDVRDVDLKTIGNKVSHNVSGAGKVAAPVHPAGQRGHGLQRTVSHPHAARGEEKSSETRVHDKRSAHGKEMKRIANSRHEDMMSIANSRREDLKSIANSKHEEGRFSW